MTREHKLLCLFIPRNAVLANNVLNPSSELFIDLRKILNTSKAANDTFSDLEITPGFKTLNANSFDSLSLDRLTNNCPSLANSLYRLSTGSNSPFNPLARIWARYLPSLDSNVTHSFDDKLKLFIRAIKSSYSNEEACRMSFFGFNLLISTSPA
jgi:hypothetical protein